MEDNVTRHGQTMSKNTEQPAAPQKMVDTDQWKYEGSPAGLSRWVWTAPRLSHACGLGYEDGRMAHMAVHMQLWPLWPDKANRSPYDNDKRIELPNRSRA